VEAKPTIWDRVRVVAGFSPQKSPAARPSLLSTLRKRWLRPVHGRCLRTSGYGCQSHRPGQPAAATQSRRDRERPRACPGEPSIAHKRPSSAVSGRSRPRPHVDVHGAQGRCCSSTERGKAVEDSASCRSPGLPAAPWSSLEEEEHHAATACRRHEIDEPRPRHIRTQPQRAAMAVPLVFTVFLRPQRGG
jgi:hypothetical protein